MDARFTYDAPFPERVMIARVYRIDQLGEGVTSSLSVELDGIDEQALDENLLELFVNRGRVKPFGLIRVEVPAGEISMMGGEFLREGAWFSFSLLGQPGPRRVRAEHAQLTELGYLEGSRGYLGDLEFLGFDDEPDFKPLSSTVTTKRKRTQKAINGGVFPSGAIWSSPWPPYHAASGLKQPVQARVRDVGQAGFVTLLDDQGAPVLHFDAGWPVSFNGHTAPASSTVTDLDAAVVLSHWDWDHLHGYYVFPALQRQEWVAPVQHLGPGASRVAAQLHAAQRLCGVAATASLVMFGNGGWGRFAVCKGAPGNKNQTGLAMDVKLAAPIGKQSDHLLMTGDADYQYATAALGGGAYSALVVTHHGAKFTGATPAPHGAGLAVVSYGKGNTYQHPDATALKAHAAWNLSHTADHGGNPRGSRTLP